MQKVYLVIDLKSFYASVECVERGLDPLTTRLVVADPTRTEKTICLAVSVEMKRLGIKNRCRVFDIPKNMDYIMAPPRMKKYIEYAAKIYRIYLNYIAPEDIHVYSIDEAFLDVTPYLKMYGKDGRGMAEMLMTAIWKEVGVRATAGVGSNMYLAKIALDIMAKKSPDFIGVLDEESYRTQLWDHRPITDFWMISGGTANRLLSIGIRDMGGIARWSSTEQGEDKLYKLFGKNAEIIIDHAWGQDDTTIKDVQAYRPKNKSLSNGQTLMRNYSYDEGALIVREMTDQLCLQMTEKNLICATMGLSIRYGSEGSHHWVEGGPTAANYRSFYDYVSGQKCNHVETNLSSVWIPLMEKLYKELVDPEKKVRAIHVTCANVAPDNGIQQISLFDDSPSYLKDEKSAQQAVVQIKHKFGKNAILKGMNFEKGATTRERNLQIGGHRSG